MFHNQKIRCLRRSASGLFCAHRDTTEITSAQFLPWREQHAQLQSDISASSHLWKLISSGGNLGVFLSKPAWLWDSFSWGTQQNREQSWCSGFLPSTMLPGPIDDYVDNVMTLMMALMMTMLMAMLMTMLMTVRTTRKGWEWLCCLVLAGNEWAG